MILLELFSGIGGFAKGIEDAGHKITTHYFSEIDNHAIANYKYNYPNAKSIGSVTTVRGADLERPNIITFGSPCQDFSMAGKRAGMEGERSSLITEAVRLISECRPDVFIWENVKGAFSSNNGADFWGIIQAFANIGGYRLEWQLLNTSWFLPQNRERIYLIGHLVGRSEPGVFPIEKSDNVYTGPNEIKEKLHKNSLPLTAKGITNNTGSFIAAQRGGRFEGDKQKLEARVDQNTNALTSVAKDNYVVTKKNYRQLDISGNGYNSQQDRIYHLESTMSCISSCRTETKLKVELADNQIRRLTEIECERLQGFPDDWTKFGNYNGTIKPIPKTARYKLLGNAVTVAVVKAIASRLTVFNHSK